jgi:hypothetical protein
MWSISSRGRSGRARRGRCARGSCGMRSSSGCRRSRVADVALGDRAQHLSGFEDDDDPDVAGDVSGAYLRPVQLGAAAVAQDPVRRRRSRSTSSRWTSRRTSASCGRPNTPASPSTSCRSSTRSFSTRARRGCAIPGGAWRIGVARDHRGCERAGRGSLAGVDDGSDRPAAEPDGRGAAQYRGRRIGVSTSSRRRCSKSATRAAWCRLRGQPELPRITKNLPPAITRRCCRARRRRGSTAGCATWWRWWSTARRCGRCSGRDPCPREALRPVRGARGRGRAGLRPAAGGDLHAGDQQPRAGAARAARPQRGRGDVCAEGEAVPGAALSGFEVRLVGDPKGQDKGQATSGRRTTFSRRTACRSRRRRT